MQSFSGCLDLDTNLGAVLIRADGSTEEYDLGSTTTVSQNWLKRMWRKLKTSRLIPLALTFAAFAQLIYSGNPAMFALVTTTGVGYMASDFASGGVTPTISGMKFQDS